jgi:tetratricopeptide (TPR) repeat protein
MGSVALVAATLAARELWFKYDIYRAVSVLARGEATAAERLFDQALHIKRGSIDALVGRAAAREQSGDVEGALAELREAVARQPREARLHLELARALTRAADRLPLDSADLRYEEAAVVYQQAAALAPHGARVLNDVGLGLRSIRRTDLAIVMFQRASAADPAWGGPDVNLADTYRDIGRYDDALALFRELETRSVEVPAYRIQNALGQVYLDSGKPHEAEQVLRRAVALSPEYAPVRMSLALALLDQRKYEAATVELEEAVRRDPQPDRIYFMCQLYALQKKADDVMRCLGRAIPAGTSREAIHKDALFGFVRDREDYRRLLGTDDGSANRQ